MDKHESRYSNRFGRIKRFDVMKFEKLGNIASIQIGRTPKRAESKYWGKGNTWVSISDLTSYEIINTKEEITDIAVNECNCKQIPKGTLLMSFKLSIGKLAFAGKDLYTNEAICGILLKDKSNYAPEYLYYALQNTKLIGSNVAVKGATLNTASLNALQIPIAGNKETQLHIANILSKAESLIAQRKESIRLLDEYLKSVFLEMFGDPVRNNKGWETKTIENLVNDEKYSIKRGPFGGALKKEIFVEEGYLVYEQFHALNNDFSFARYYIDEDKFQELKGFEVKSGDIIISCSGVYLGKLAIVPKGAKQGIINQALLKISLDNSKMDNKFFVFLFSHSSFKNEFFGSTRGSGIPNFPPMTEFKKFKFIYPPFELQTQFCQIAEKTESLKAQYQQSLQELENLYVSLSQKAFKGELNITDESLLMAAEPNVEYLKTIKS